MFRWTISMRYFDYIRARVFESSDLSIRMKLQLERSDWNTNTFTLTYALTNEEIATLVNMLQHQNDTLVLRNLFFPLRFHDSNRIPRVVRLGSSSVYAVDAEILEYRDVAVLSFLFSLPRRSNSPKKKRAPRTRSYGAASAWERTERSTSTATSSIRSRE